MKIAIIGAGLTGSTILETIIKHKNFNSSTYITVFDKRSFYGAGFPHEYDSNKRVLNVQSHLMSVDDNNPLDFVEWLNKNNKEESFEKVAPRTYYGEYLHDYFKKYYENKNVKFINSEVIDVIPNTSAQKIQSYNIKTENNIYNDFDYLFLALGHPVYKNIYDFKETNKYIWDVYPLNNNLSSIKKSDKVGIIGTGATSLDVFRHLMSKYKNDTSIYFLSRSSLFDTPDFTYDLEKPEYRFSMSQEWIDEKLDRNDFINLNDTVNLIKDDFEINGTNFYELLEKMKFNDLEDYRKFIDEKDPKIIILIDYFKKLFPYLAILYGNLSKLDKLEFIEKYDEDIDKFITLIPAGTFNWIYDEEKKENVKIIKGLENIEYKDNKFFVEANTNVDLDILVNTTGFTFNILENIEYNKLLKNLYDKYLIKPDSDGDFISVQWPNCNALSVKYGLIDNLFIQGMWIGKTHYRNNDALSVNRLAKKVSNRFMEKL